MGGSDNQQNPPTVNEVAAVFDVYDVYTDGDAILYVGEPAISGRKLETEVWQLFRDRGYEVSLHRGYSGDDSIPIARSEFVLVAEPFSNDIDGIPWTNVILFVLTVFSTLFAGAVFWYQIPITDQPWRIVEAWPFMLAIMGVLGIHELGHYVLSRHHNVKATLPYFIPVPTYIGSLGAVIKMEGRIPDRKALFDIGVAGPLAGLVATVVVTAIGLQLEPLSVQEAAAADEDTGAVIFNHPPLLDIIAMLTGTTEQLEDGLVHPVVFGGWVGMLVTLLNMLPVGQLDGGHILRSLAGAKQEAIARLVPLGLFGLAAYAFFIVDGADSVMIWVLWGLFAIGLAYAGPAQPINDEPIGKRRIAIGIITFVLAALCFTPVPVEIIEPNG